MYAHTGTTYLPKYTKYNIGYVNQKKYFPYCIFGKKENITLPKVCDKPHAIIWKKENIYLRYHVDFHMPKPVNCLKLSLEFII